MNHSVKISPVGLALAGLVSALLCSVVKDSFTNAAIFGTTIGIYLGAFGGLRSFLRLGAFTVACVVAYPLTIMIVFFLRLGDSQTLDPNLLQFFVAGGVGTFFVLFAGLSLFGTAYTSAAALGFAVLGGFVGGVLGLIGGALDRTYESHHPGEFSIWVYLIWQTGIALTLGLILRWGQNTSPSESRESESASRDNPTGPPS
jgi:hypothetical protein